MFNVGDKCEITEDPYGYHEHDVGVTGVLVHKYYSDSWLLKRDDGELGGGPNGEWVVNEDRLKLIHSGLRVKIAAHEPSAHIAGLSPENVTRAIYDDAIQVVEAPATYWR